MTVYDPADAWRKLLGVRKHRRLTDAEIIVEQAAKDMRPARAPRAKMTPEQLHLDRMEQGRRGAAARWAGHINKGRPRLVRSRLEGMDAVTEDAMHNLDLLTKLVAIDPAVDPQHRLMRRVRRVYAR